MTPLTGNTHSNALIKAGLHVRHIIELHTQDLTGSVQGFHAPEVVFMLGGT